MPRDMSYKQTAKAVLNRARNIRLAIWTCIATIAFALGWSALLVLGMPLVIAITVGLVLLTAYRVVNMVYWMRAGKAALSAADDHIKIIDPEEWDKKPEPKAKVSKKNGLSATPLAGGAP